MMFRLNRVWLLLFALVILGVIGAGCGKKGWPVPQVDEDRFHWGEIQHQRQDACLDVRALVHGASKKLGFVHLEWMQLESNEDCPGCPFQPTGRILLGDGSSEFKRQNGVIRILLCEWEPSASYQWRLVGMNVHGGLGSVESPVQFSR
ncbi:hypothetical protein SAMN05660653_00331 [Desulfonatronum thiosulfatophilum]|uniref:Lipoprotein n=1 Tax=Desulfonatronum thiosulfatophilum TaxID=617002 RepID=A0A1G6AH43_9BACT|nr:hypothetical protein [Desulfonatronum thiosulfatophilum]SDB07737.1 hypothetical protein SAMN05660653_00331 [Desulfonatronum thiosulfatophilum]